MAQRQFQVVPDEETEASPQPGAPAVAMLALALKALSQRALIALSNLFCLLTAASVFYLWAQMPEDPSYQRIGALSIYAAFIVILNMIVRKR